ncbi:MAG: MBL fold metallo-hydrolase [Candidatus Aminicenantes bacterium]|jgi:L-ascorbate metabolism protein UlaG (beta-lactamase superfamily)
MRKKTLLLGLLLMSLVGLVLTQKDYSTDVFQTSKGDLKITPIGHGSVMMEFEGKTIHIDPYSRVGDYSRLPKANLILITHDHSDHLDPKAIAAIRTEKTGLVLSEKCAETVEGGVIMKNGDTKTVQGIKIEAVPAYNIVHKRSSGEPYHIKGEGNGYILTFGDKRVYVAGDTENTPEMKALTDIHIAFLPMNLPYTMSPEMVADAAKAFRPKFLYPYHYGRTDTSELVELLKDVEGMAVRIR